MSIGMAIVGAGRWGPHLIRNFATDPRSSVEWIVDVDPTRRELVAERFPGIRVTGDIAEPLEGLNSPRFRGGYPEQHPFSGREVCR